MCLSVCVLASVFIRVLGFRCLCLFVRSFVCLCLSSLVCLLACLFVCLSAGLFACLIASVCVFVYWCGCLLACFVYVCVRVFVDMLV